MSIGHEKSDGGEAMARRLKQLAWLLAIGTFIAFFILGLWSGQFVSEDQQLGSPFLFRTLG